MEPTLRAQRFAILTAPAACHACNAPMAMSALLVPAYVHCDEDEDEWISVDEAARSAWTARAADPSRSV